MENKNNQPKIQKNSPEDYNQAIADAIEQNSSNSPHISIDPDTNKLGVVGDPNEIGKPDGKYHLEFEYTEDMLSDEEKQNLRYEEDIDRYYLDMHYENKRVKPLYRSKVVLILVRILTDMHVMDDTGYTTNQQLNMLSEKLISHAEDVAELAHLVLGVTKEQLEYMTEYSILAFFNDLMRNEPNILKECVVFLVRPRTEEKTDKK